MNITPSRDFPGTYFISGAGVSSQWNAELCYNGDIKIQIWDANRHTNLVPKEDLELLYFKISKSVWMPLFNNGRLL